MDLPKTHCFEQQKIACTKNTVSLLCLTFPKPLLACLSLVWVLIILLYAPCGCNSHIPLILNLGCYIYHGQLSTWRVCGYCLSPWFLHTTMMEQCVTWWYHGNSISNMIKIAAKFEYCGCVYLNSVLLITLTGVHCTLFCFLWQKQSIDYISV